MDKEEIETTLLNVFEVSLEAQLRAIRRLRAGEPEVKPSRKGISQVGMVYDILQEEGRPLHISQIIQRVEQKHGRRLERESIVSALVKWVRRNERFVRTGKNVFALKGGK